MFRGGFRGNIGGLDEVWRGFERVSRGSEGCRADLVW